MAEEETSFVEEVFEQESNAIDLLKKEKSPIYESRVSNGELFKAEGNKWFKKGNLSLAIQLYERGLFHLKFDEGTWAFELLPKHHTEVNAVRKPVHLNLTACYLADGPHQDVSKALQHAKSALEIDPKDTKANFRAGQAHLRIGNLSHAKTHLMAASKALPNDKAIRQEVLKLKAELETTKKREKELWKGALKSGNNKSDGHTAPPKNTDRSTSNLSSRTAAESIAWVTIMVLVAIVFGWYAGSKSP